MKCVICSTEMQQAFCAKILDKYDVKYYRCSECGFLQTEAPYWLEEAYSNAIVDTDTGLVMRNISICTRLAALLYCSFDPQGTYIDFAGGYGLLVRLMRDIGFDFYWEDKYCQNLMAKGFESSQISSPITAVTAFELFEHLEDPISFVSETMKKYEVDSLIFSTELYTGIAAPASSWWYYARNGGQHISFFQTATLQKIASVLGLHFYSMHGLHVFTSNPLKRPILAHALTSCISIPTALYIRKRLGSKTMIDHLKQSKYCECNANSL